MLNLSAQPPDQRLFLATVYGLDHNRTCTSTISQADADRCQLVPSGQRVIFNGSGTSTGPASGGVITYTNGEGCIALTQEAADRCAQELADQVREILNNMVMYSSAAQSCTADCEGAVSYTAPAGAATGLTQAEADATAQQFACAMSLCLCEGGDCSLYTSASQSCAVSCALGGSVAFATNAGLFTANSQAIADSIAFAFACQVADYLCSLVVLVPSTAQSCTVNCRNGGSRTFSFPAGSFVATTQLEANQLALLLACLVAEIACDIPQEGTGTDRPEEPVLYGNSRQACSLPCTGGTFRYTVRSGEYEASSKAVANSIAHENACRLAQEQLSCLSPFSPNGCVGSFYSSFIVASPHEAINWSITGSLPPGLYFEQGLIDGFPTTPGDYSFTVSAPVDGGGVAARAYAIRIIQITTSSLPGGNFTYPGATLEQSGGKAPITWSMEYSSLPPGLELSSSGGISGTPTVPGTFDFTVKATDADGYSCTKDLSIRIIQITTSSLPGGIYTVAPPTPYAGATLAQLGGEEPITWSLESGSLPPGLSLSSSGSISGSPTAPGTFTFTVKAVDVDGYSCTKVLSITVVAPEGIDWGSLAWTPQQTASSPYAGAGGSASATGPNYQVESSSGSAGAFPAYEHETWQVVGQLIYTGPAQNCELQFTGIRTPDVGTFARLTVYVLYGGSFVVSQLYPGGPGGAVVIPFSIPASVGQQIMIIFNCDAAIDYPSGNNSASSVIGVVVNV